MTHPCESCLLLQPKKDCGIKGFQIPSSLQNSYSCRTQRYSVRDLLNTFDTSSFALIRPHGLINIVIHYVVYRSILRLDLTELVVCLSQPYKLPISPINFTHLSSSSEISGKRPPTNNLFVTGASLSTTSVIFS